MTESVTDRRGRREGRAKTWHCHVESKGQRIQGCEEPEEVTDGEEQRKLLMERNRWEGWFGKAADAVFWILENILHIFRTLGGKELS